MLLKSKITYLHGNLEYFDENETPATNLKHTMYALIKNNMKT